MKRLAGLVSLALALSLAGACDKAEATGSKITAEDCEKLGKRMLSYTVMESAKTAAQQEEMKKDLLPAYVEACKAELPTQSAYECAMASPFVFGMSQCKFQAFFFCRLNGPLLFWRAPKS